MLSTAVLIGFVFAGENSRRDAKELYKDGMAAFIGALVDAHNQNQKAFEEELLKTLEQVDSTDDIEQILDIILYPAENKLENIPDEIQYALEKTIRNVPDKLKVGTFLFQFYQSGDSDIKHKIKQIRHPVMSALLCAEAYENEKNDPVKIDLLWKQFKHMEPSEIIESFILAAGEASSNTERVAEALYDWIQKHPEAANAQNILEDYIGKPDANPDQRAAAAYAMGAFNNPRSIQALKKAYQYIDNPYVKAYIEMALKKNSK
jgi:hypothetical protein